MLSLTFKNLWARKWRSLMTAVAVIFGIALVAGTYILTDTTNQAFDQIFNESLAGTDVVVSGRAEVDQQDGGFWGAAVPVDRFGAIAGHVVTWVSRVAPAPARCGYRCARLVTPARQFPCAR